MLVLFFCSFLFHTWVICNRSIEFRHGWWLCGWVSNPTFNRRGRLSLATGKEKTSTSLFYESSTQPTEQEELTRARIALGWISPNKSLSWGTLLFMLLLYWGSWGSWKQHWVRKNWYPHITKYPDKKVKKYWSEMEKISG